jgi:hypothetical protein
VDDALTLFQVEIKAGSTGKPTAKTDRDAMGVLLPLLQGLVDKISMQKLEALNAYKAGNPNAMADVDALIEPQKALLTLALQRLDERKIDIDQFIPEMPMPPPMPAPPMAGGGVVPPELANVLAAAGGGAPPAMPPVLPQ